MRVSRSNILFEDKGFAGESDEGQNDVLLLSKCLLCRHCTNDSILLGQILISSQPTAICINTDTLGVAQDTCVRSGKPASWASAPPRLWPVTTSRSCSPTSRAIISVTPSEPTRTTLALSASFGRSGSHQKPRTACMSERKPPWTRHDSTQRRPPSSGVEPKRAR